MQKEQTYVELQNRISELENQNRLLEEKLHEKISHQGSLSKNSSQSEQTQTPNRLLVLEQKYSTLINNIDVGVVYLNLNGEILYFNDKAEGIFELKHANISLNFLIQVFSEEEIIKFNECLLQIRKIGKSDSFVFTKEKFHIKESYRIDFHVTVLQNNTFSGIQLLIFEIESADNSPEKNQYHYHLEEIIKERTGELLLMNDNYEKEITERKQVEALLRESEFKFRTVAEFTYDIEFWLDQTMQFNYISPSCSRITGYSVGEFRSDSSIFFNIIEKKHKEEVTEIINIGMSKQTSKSIDYKIQDKNGLKKWLSLVFFPIIQYDVFLGLRGNIRDITNQMETREKLQQSEDLYHTTINAINEGIYVVDKNLKVVLVNDSLTNSLEEYGLNTKIMGKFLWEALPFLSEKVIKQYWNIFETGNSETIQTTTKINDKKLHHEIRRIPIFESGKPIRVLTTIENLTELKHSKQQLEIQNKKLHEQNEQIISTNNKLQKINKALVQSERNYRDLVNNLQEGIVILDEKLKVIFANRYFQSMTGYKTRYLEMISFVDIIDNTAPNVEFFNQENLIDTPIFNIELIIECADRKNIIVNINSTPLKREGDKNIQILLSVSNISERIKSEEKLKHQFIELQNKQSEIEKNNVKLKKINDELFNTNEKLYIAKEKINETKNFLKVLLDTLPQPIFYKTTCGKFISCNKAFEKFVGRSRKELQDWKVEDIFDNKNTVIDQLSDQKILNHPDVADKYETQYISNTKERKYLAIDKKAYYHKDGEIGGIITAVHDITELRKTEEDLKLIKERLELSMSSGNISWWTWNIKKDELFFDDRNLKLLGYKRDEINFTSYPFVELIHPDDKKFTMEVLNQHLEGNTTVYEIDYRIKTRSGNYRWFYDIGKVSHRDDDGNALMLNGIVFDVTTRKKVAEDLKESEEKFKNIIAQSADGIALTDNNGNIIEWNSSMNTITSLDKYTVMGQNIIEVFTSILVARSSRKMRFLKLMNEIKQALKNGHSKYFFKLLNNRIQLKSGELKHIQTVLFPIKYKNGFMLGIITRDTTKGVKSEEELKRSKRKLKDMNISLEKRVAQEVERNRAKDQLISLQSRQAAMGEMIGNIAHQWRQPLNTIGIIIQNLEDDYEYGDLDAEFLNHKVKEMMKIINFMSQTIDDFRNFFKIDKEKQSFKIIDVVNKSKEIISASFTNKNISIDINIKENLTLQGYPNEFSQVAFIILNNAKDVILERKLKNGKIDIKAYTEKEKTFITFTDNAGGIQEEIIDKIFDPYFTTKNQTQGTGIGLYMSKVIIEKNMLGKLYARNVNDGACFIIEFENAEAS